MGRMYSLVANMTHKMYERDILCQSLESVWPEMAGSDSPNTLTFPVSVGESIESMEMVRHVFWMSSHFNYNS